MDGAGTDGLIVVHVAREADAMFNVTISSDAVFRAILAIEAGATHARALASVTHSDAIRESSLLEAARLTQMANELSKIVRQTEWQQV